MTVFSKKEREMNSWICDSVCTLHVPQHTACATTHCMCHAKPWEETLLSGWKGKGRSLICHEVAGQGYTEVESTAISKREFPWRTQDGRCPMGNIVCSMKQGAQLGEKDEEDKGRCVCCWHEEERWSCAWQWAHQKVLPVTTGMGKRITWQNVTGG